MWRWMTIFGVALALLAVDGRLFAAGHGAATDAGGHGEAAQQDAGDGHGGGHGGEAAEEAPPPYALGPALDGYFDVNVLRSTHRVHNLRHETGDVTITIWERDRHSRSGRRLEPRKHLLLMAATVEFGRESGMAEAHVHAKDIQQTIREVGERFEWEELLSVPGKLRLKRTLVRALNRRLQTAQVRQVYLTDFQMK